MSKRVLVAPLDWGLGHATRCIPIIHVLLSRGCTVFLSGSGDALKLLQAEFPQLTILTLTGYRPRYPRSGSMVLAMARQLPRFMRAIRREHGELEALIHTHGIELVIADNRYGCYTRQLPCIFITHQRNILMPRGFGWLAPWVRRLNTYYSNKFSACWVPDAPGAVLSGELSAADSALHDRLPVEFTGILSRFSRGEAIPEVYDIVAVCSGPEPQRSIFEALITAQLERSGLSYVVVRGTPGGEREHVRGLLTSKELEQVMKSARLIVARSGYSTIMDLAALGKRAILIPTPGQTEQEYLARRLKEKRIAFSVAQDEFDLLTAIEQAKAYDGFEGIVVGKGRLEELVEGWV
jgi:hypothetical protein